MKFHIVLTLLVFSLASLSFSQEWIIFNESNSIIPNDIIKDIDRDQYGTYWISTMDGVCSYKNSNWKLYNQNNCDMQSSGVHCAAIEGDSIWFGTAGELMLYNIKTDIWVNYDLEDYIPGVQSYSAGCYVSDISISKAGVKYIGTDEGLIVFDNKTFTRYYAGNSGLTYDHIYHRVMVDPFYDSVVWMGLYEGGMARFDGSTFSFYIPVPDWSTLGPSAYDHINDISFDVDSNIWTAGMMGVMCIDKNTMKVIDHYGPNDGLQDGYFWAVEFEDSMIWIGSDLLGSLGKCTNGFCICYNSLNSGMPAWESTDDTQVSTILIDDNGNKWMSTFTGVVIYKEGGVMLSSVSEQEICQLSLVVYPNPSNGKEIHILSNDKLSGFAAIEIMTVDGKLFKKQTLELVENSVNKLPFVLPSGLYVLNIKTEKGWQINRPIAIY